MKPERDEDDELDGMRSVWRAMREEEPSSRGMDALMAAASAKATQLAMGTRPPEEGAVAVPITPAPITPAPIEKVPAKASRWPVIALVILVVIGAWLIARG